MAKKIKEKPSVVFNMDGWTLYSYEKEPFMYDVYLKEKENAIAEGKSAIETLPKDNDVERIKKGDNLIRLIAEKKMKHHYRIYKDWAFGNLNREILTCDEKEICVTENNIGELMAYSEYLESQVEFGAFEKLEKDGWLAIHIADEHCLHCPYN